MPRIDTDPAESYIESIRGEGKGAVFSATGPILFPNSLPPFGKGGKGDLKMVSCQG